MALHSTHGGSVVLPTWVASALFWTLAVGLGMADGLERGGLYTSTRLMSLLRAKAAPWHTVR